MASLGQVLMARDMADDRSAFNKDLRGASKQAQKRSRWGGLGRGLLALAGGALAGPLGAGIGSFLGSRAGSGLAGGHKEIQDRRFFNEKITKGKTGQLFLMDRFSLKTKTVYDFDKYITAPLNNYQSPEELYNANSSKYVIKNMIRMRFDRKITKTVQNYTFDPKYWI